MTRVRPLPLAAAAAMVLAVAMMFLYAPTEALQGEVQRIFYIHVPSAWVTYLSVVVLAAASVLVLGRGGDWRRWDRTASSAAELGALFATVMLATGSIWGRRVWGVWWVWDARLTSTLVLWLLLVGYLIFRGLVPEGRRRARLSAVIGIIAAVDIPVVHFAVVWWRTLHPQPTVLRPGGPELPGEMLITLLVSLAAFTLMWTALLSKRMRIEEARQRLSDIRADAALEVRSA